MFALAPEQSRWPSPLLLVFLMLALAARPAAARVFPSSTSDTGRSRLSGERGWSWPAGQWREGTILPGGGGCWGGAGTQPLAYLTVEFCRFRLFVLKCTIYKLAFPGETPSPVEEPCKSLQPVLCCRMAGLGANPRTSVRGSLLTLLSATALGS